MMKNHRSAWYLSLLRYAGLALYGLITLIPFLWAISASFKPLQEIVSGEFSLWPSTLLGRTTSRYFYGNRCFYVGCLIAFLSP
jgi:multiple sugar transport system permease protein